MCKEPWYARKFCKFHYSRWYQGIKINAPIVRHPGLGYVSEAGYKRIKAFGKRAYMEHRFIMEQHLGRRLLKSEIVHHKNQNRLDNRLKNLQVMTIGEHTAHHLTGVFDPFIKCSIEKCNKRMAARGYCHGHYRKIYYTPPKNTCSKKNCTKIVLARKMCGTHYAFWRRHNLEE